MMFNIGSIASATRVTLTQNPLARAYITAIKLTGAPIVVSFPHFLYADWRYVNNVKGLSPNETNHEIFVNLEPVSELFTFFSVIKLTDDCRLVERR